MAKRTRYIGEIRNHAYGKRQTSDSSREFLKIQNKQIKTVQTETILKDKTSEKLFFSGESINSKRQVKRNLDHVDKLTFAVNVTVNLLIMSS